MDLLLFLSPIGILFLAVLLGTMYSHLRATHASITSQRRASAALITAGKKVSRQTVGLVLDVRRKAEHYEPLIRHLAEHADAVELIAVVYRTAGPRAAVGIRRVARQAGVRLRVVTHAKGLSLTSTLRRVQAPFVMRIEADDRLSKRFCEYVGYAFAAGVTVLYVPRLRVAQRTIWSAFESLTSIIRHAFRASLSTLRGASLPTGVVVLRTAIEEASHPLPVRFLADDFALLNARLAPTIRTRSIVRLAGAFATLLIVSLVLMTTPTDLLLFLLAVTGTLLWVSATLTVLNVRAFSLQQKTALIAVVPFYPLYGVIQFVRSFLQK